MSVLDSVLVFRLDRADGPIVLTSTNRSQRDIKRTLEKLASKYVGREVHVIYPAGYEPRP